MKKINLDLGSVLDGVARLESLQERVKSDIEIPDIEGSGETASAIHELAETFKTLEDIWQEIVGNSIVFFNDMEKTQENTQLDLAAAIKGILDK